MHAAFAAPAAAFAAVSPAATATVHAIPLHWFLIVAVALFAIGSAGVLARRNALTVLMSVEIMLNAVNLALVAFNRSHSGSHSGQMFAFFLIAAEAAEVAVGLAIVLSLFRIRRTVRSDDADLLKN